MFSGSRRKGAFDEGSGQLHVSASFCTLKGWGSRHSKRSALMLIEPARGLSAECGEQPSGILHTLRPIADFQQRARSIFPHHPAIAQRLWVFGDLFVGVERAGGAAVIGRISRQTSHDYRQVDCMRGVRGGVVVEASRCALCFRVRWTENGRGWSSKSGGVDAPETGSSRIAYDDGCGCGCGPGREGSRAKMGAMGILEELQSPRTGMDGGPRRWTGFLGRCRDNMPQRIARWYNGLREAVLDYNVHGTRVPSAWLYTSAAINNRHPYHPNIVTHRRRAGS
ncbi:hypothetical protein K458DRAFT_409440 [Lentithecium fluviatile CBS 122367]|uniref:Uncharacterized protein n=1 Tax=Lentithecium fluviatile CBS 122367 TaxID=1168545 RepID=A0A6G1IIJ0_9PLEO|nr:hypothetical protein K458DRAFT_409440 [Lentithecium fluviatile CBS 122367]